MNIKNGTLFIADNLDIMRGMDSETIDLIYLDPPFNTNAYENAGADGLYVCDLERNDVSASNG